ncbi:MAG TPA: porphobilinogen synthase, partial [Brevundimonas sp.]|nr:porphobilinogen synthase [Brevundimonas sp.]
MSKLVFPASFPLTRGRRLRSQPWVRRLVAETTLTPADLVWPLILHDGKADRVPVATLPGVD